MRPSLLALLLLATGGCAAAATAGAVDRPAVFLSDRAAPHATCRVLYEPAALPPVSALVDSAALAEAVQAYAARYPLSEGRSRALYSVAIAGDARVERLDPIDFWLPRGREDEFHTLVRRHLRTEAAPANVRLRVEPGADPVLRVGRSEYCPPRPNTRFRLETPAIVDRDFKPRPVRARMNVDAEGRVIGSHILAGSGDPELDRWVVTSLQNRVLIPGTIDGVRVAMQYEETIPIQARR